MEVGARDGRARARTATANTATTPPNTAGVGKRRAFGQEILADRIRRQVEAKLWNLAADISRERIAIWERARLCAGGTARPATSWCR